MIQFHSNEKRDLSRINYARAGCYWHLNEDYFQRILRLTALHGGDMTNVTDLSFFVQLLEKGQPARYHYFGDPGSLHLVNVNVYTEVAFTDRGEMRWRGFKGAGLRLDLCSKTAGRGAAGLDSIARLKDGSWEAVFPKHGYMRFRALRGSIDVNVEYDYEKGCYSRLEISFLPDEEGRFEAACYDYPLVFKEPELVSFETIREENLASYLDFYNNYKGLPEEYAGLVEDSIYVTWSHVLRAGGFVKSPMILMHYNALGSGFSWQQSYNGMALLGNPEEGFRLIGNMFLYQNPINGNLPSTVNPNSVNDFSRQAPLQGFALNLLVRRCGEEFITPEMAADLLPKFGRWVNFWTDYRNAGRGDDVIAIHNPNESGWDDASTFKDGFPASNADTIALIIECMYACATLARRMGDAEQEAHWQGRADRLLNTLVTEFWDGEKFVTKVRGKNVDCMSLACYLPILLGDRLPQHIIDKVAEKLTEEDQFLTSVGLCTENINSPLCHWGFHFVLGRAVAPAQMFASVGLYLAGKKEEAQLIARRWCDTVEERGLRLGYQPYNEYPYSGEPAHMLIQPVIGDSWSWCGWSACTTMTILQVVLGDA